LEETIRHGLSEMAANLRGALSIQVQSIDLPTGSGVHHLGLEAYIPSANDVLEFVVEIGPDAAERGIAGYLGWQAAGEEIATWGTFGRGVVAPDTMFREAVASMIEAARIPRTER
jgi:hypothetical protein